MFSVCFKFGKIGNSLNKVSLIRYFQWELEQAVQLCVCQS